MTGLVLLSGATGFVGRQVLRVLLEYGCQVRVIARTAEHPALANVAGLESVVTTPDLFAESPEWFSAVCQGVDLVIHAAWYAEPGKYLQSPKNLECLMGTLLFAKIAAQTGARRFVGIGTCFEYDLTVGKLSIETPLKPLTPYAGAKAAAYFALSQWFSTQETQFVWARLFYLYGEGEDERRLVPHIRKRLAANEPAELTSGTQIRDFLDIREAGQQIVQAALGSQLGAVNICSSIPITVRQLAEKVADEYGRRDLLLFGARPDNFIDPPCVLGIK
ncbi:MAG: NAD(P)-dependent oxidoreductase [Verrucomicrobiota bacterium]